MKKGAMIPQEIEYELDAVCATIDIDGMSIMDMLQDPDAWHGAGQLARLGCTLETIGMMLTEAAKQCVMGGGTHDDAGVRFEWVNPWDGRQLDSRKVKDAYPEADFENLYKDAHRDGYVKVLLPK